MEEDVLEQFTLTSRNIVTEKMSRSTKPAENPESDSDSYSE